MKIHLFLYFSIFLYTQSVIYRIEKFQMFSSIKAKATSQRLYQALQSYIFERQQEDVSPRINILQYRLQLSAKFLGKKGLS
jgi:hypothetical protein